jgi:hypothetical protein
MNARRDKMRNANEAKEKRIAALIFVLSLLFMSGQLIAQERNSAEFNISAVGTSLTGRFGFIPAPKLSIGLMKDSFGIELGGIVSIGGALISGNVVISPFNDKKVTPYITGGLWTTTIGGLGWNVGGGIKIMLNRKLAARFELQRWGFFEEGDFGIYFISGGFSFFL